MANREEYNICMRPYMTGSKPKEQRKLDFCVGAKICSSRAETREEAETLCGQPKAQQPTAEVKLEENPCAGITSIKAWIEEPDDKVCRPCLLAPLTAWYKNQLEESGFGELATELTDVVISGENEYAIAAKLDEVKGRVNPELKARLREFDCHAQVYKGGENGQ